MFRRRLLCSCTALLALAAGGCTTVANVSEMAAGLVGGGERFDAPLGYEARDDRAVASAFQDIGYATWSDYEPPYRFYPGDEIEVSVPSAPELNRTVMVQPDGRIVLPLIAPVMAADRTVTELQQDLAAAYASQLLRPEVVLGIKSTTPLKVYVLGEVGTPGVYDMHGDINSLQAIAQAGGFKTTANRSQVVIIRRGPQGRGMARTADLLKGLKNPAGADLVPLRRFDIVYVPRSGVAEAGLFVQQYFRDLTPIQFGFNYAVGGTNP